MTVRDIVQAAAGVSTGNPNAWDVSKAYYDGPGNNLAVFSPLGSKSVISQNSVMRTIGYSEDGLNLFAGDSLQIYKYPQTNTQWTIAGGYTQTTGRLDLGGTGSISLTGIWFKPDGTKFWITDSNGNRVLQYSLSTAWDLTTQTYDSVSLTVTAQTGTPFDICMSPDGVYMMILDADNDRVLRYSMGTPWNLATASYNSQTLSVSAQNNNPRAISFLPDGKTMYYLGGNKYIYKYTFGTAWNLTTGSYTGSSADGTSWIPQAFIFGLVVQPFGSALYSYNTDATSSEGIVWASIGGVLTTETNSLRGLFFNEDGDRMYVVGIGSDSVIQYGLSTAWDLSTASLVGSFSVNAQDTAPSAVSFKPDGTKMYVLGGSGDDVNEYNLSVAWDVTSATYLQNFSVATEETAPRGMYFKDDGTRMFICGTSGDDVNEYSLSTPWNISTASYVQNFSVSSQTSAPVGVFIGNNGKSMFIIGGYFLYEYSLATSWNISTASYIQSIQIGQSGVPAGSLYFRPDGMQFFCVADKTVQSFLIAEE